METDPNTVINKTVNILDSMKNDPAHIMNLGHGIRPGAKIECMKALVSTVKAYGS
jgi:uroporphyrinogen decarboxylase